MDKLQTAPIIIGKLLNIGGILQKSGNKLLLQFNINQQQFSILFEISKAGKVKQKDMVNRLELEKAHVSKVVKKLQSMNLVSITISDEDKRSAWLEVTSKGKKLIKECMEIFNNWNKEWIKDISEKEIISILDDLSLLQSVFKDKNQ